MIGWPAVQEESGLISAVWQRSEMESLNHQKQNIEGGKLWIK